MKSLNVMLGLIGLLSVAFASLVLESPDQNVKDPTKTGPLKRQVSCPPTPDCPTECAEQFNGCYALCCSFYHSPCTGNEHDANTATCREQCYAQVCQPNGCDCGCSGYPDMCIETAPSNKKRTISEAEGENIVAGAVHDLAKKDVLSKKASDTVDCPALCRKEHKTCYNACCKDQESKGFDDTPMCESVCAEVLCSPGGCGQGCTGDESVCNDKSSLDDIFNSAVQLDLSVFKMSRDAANELVARGDAAEIMTRNLSLAKRGHRVR